MSRSSLAQAAAVSGVGGNYDCLFAAQMRFNVFSNRRFHNT